MRMSGAKTVFFHPFLPSTITISLAIEIVLLPPVGMPFMLFNNPTIIAIAHSGQRCIITAITAGKV